MKFITITIDPTFINTKSSDEMLLDYMITAIEESLINTKYIGFMYGCVERHKNGIPHIHMICEQVNYSKKLRLELKYHFTNNKTNNKAVDEGIARWPASIEYINKNEDGDSIFFGYGHKFPLIDFTCIRLYGLPQIPEENKPVNDNKPIKSPWLQFLETCLRTEHKPRADLREDYVQ